MRQVRRYVIMVSLGLASIGCASVPIEAVNRASREFSCPSERIAAVQRADIASNVYYLNVCGAMVRYSCIDVCGAMAGTSCVSVENTPVQCTREPPPPRWDLDPAQVVTLPRPAGVPTDLQTPATCDSYALRACLPCLERSDAGWRWHQCVSGPGPTGLRS